MTFAEKLHSLSEKCNKLRSVLQTEEATKNALILPFISLLGYDIFDPTEVIPEFVADVGIKKGEKVDYAIKKDGKIIMLYECKHCGGDLNLKHASQLYRYFAVTDARIAVLTNGIQYKFYTDLEAPNKMDERPFLELNLQEVTEAVTGELEKLTRDNFDIENLLTTAGELKYTRQIKKLIAAQLERPTDDFVKLFASKVYDGVLTPARREYFADLVKRSFKQLVNDQINDRLKAAMSGPVDNNASEPEVESQDTKTVVTTPEELEGYYIIKSLLRDLVDTSRILHRDTQSYMGILLDDNNRKPLARLYFNRTQKHIGVFDEQRREERIAINSLDDIYSHAEKMRRVFAFYESENPKS